MTEWLQDVRYIVRTIRKTAWHIRHRDRRARARHRPDDDDVFDRAGGDPARPAVRGERPDHVRVARNREGAGPARSVVPPRFHGPPRAAGVARFGGCVCRRARHRVRRHGVARAPARRARDDQPDARAPCRAGGGSRLDRRGRRGRCAGGCADQLPAMAVAVRWASGRDRRRHPAEQPAGHGRGRHAGEVRVSRSRRTCGCRSRWSCRRSAARGSE